MLPTIKPAPRIFKYACLLVLGFFYGPWLRLLGFVGWLVFSLPIVLALGVFLVVRGNQRWLVWGLGWGCSACS